MAYARKDYLGTRADTTLNGAINNSTTSITITSATGWPSVSNTGFYAVIDPDTASEEKVFVTARSGTGLTATRGVDGTTGVSHSSGATIRPCISGVDFDEANYMVAETVGNVTAAGDLLVAAGANDLTRLAKGSNSTVLAVDSGGTLGYTTVTNAMVNASAGLAYSKLEQVSTGTLIGNRSGSTTTASASSTNSFGVWTTVRKTSDETQTADFEDTSMQFAMEADVLYEFEALLVFKAGSGAGYISAQLNLPRSGYWVYSATYQNEAGTSVNVPARLSGPSSYSALTAQVSTTLKRCIFYNGVVMGTGNSGSVIWGWAGMSPASSPVTIYAGSYLRYRQIT